MNPTLRGPWGTTRFKSRTLVYHDKNQMRFVISRKAHGITRKTSRCYQTGLLRDVLAGAMKLAERLKKWPADKLPKFRF